MKIKVSIIGLMASLSFCHFALAASPSAPPATPTAAQQCAYNGQNYQTAVQFEQNIQKALAANDIDTFATLFTYPMRVNQTASKHYQVYSVRDMIIRYPTIMTPTMKQYILADQPSDIFCNYQGVMMGRGSIWFQANKKTVYSIVMNVISHS